MLLFLNVAYVIVLNLKLLQACQDASPFCGAWNEQGFCKPTSPYSSHVRKECIKSCGLCPPQLAANVNINCKDKSSYCSSYAPYCNDPGYKSYLITQCKKTCNFCHLTTMAPPTTPYVSTQPYTGHGGRNIQPSCGKKGPGHTRIVGGTNARPGDWPWQVNIDYKYNSGNPGHHCGGTLITEEWVLSAAHCFYNDQNKDNYWFKLGEHDIKTSDKWEQRFTIKELILHPKYNPNGHNYDLALLRINGKASFNERVRPACLPGGKDDFPVGTECFITGWGLLKEYGSGPAILQQAKVPLVSKPICKKAFEDLQYDVTSNMLCAGHAKGHIDACDGDSGGPLVCKIRDASLNEDIWYLWGTISWGVGCARKDFYGVFASSKVLRPWIDNVVFNQSS